MSAVSLDKDLRVTSHGATMRQIITTWIVARLGRVLNSRSTNAS